MDLEKILFATSEAAPFAKTGGLGDVAGSLPGALVREGAQVCVIMPKYGAIPQEYKARMTFIKSITVALGWRNQYCGILSLVHNGVMFYFIDNEFYFGSNHLYGYIHEDVEKFCFFSKAVLSVLPDIGFRPDVIFANDWQTAAIPLLLKSQFYNNEFYQGIKTVMTIHNLRFQGVWDPKTVTDVLGLDKSYFAPDKLEYRGAVNLLKGGIAYADVVSTVSPTYAEEIKTNIYGEGLEGLLSARSGDLVGILNGISYEEYNPAADELIYSRYNRRDFISGKRLNKFELQKELGLARDVDAMTIGVVSRLTDQKGFNLIGEMMEELMGMHIQLVVLGTGEENYEKMFRAYGEKYPERISANIRFDNGLAHKIYAGCDAFLMPSAFEPCGLSQMISMRYGTLPIGRETGGLKDSIIPYNEFTGEGTGFTFGPYNAGDLLAVTKYAAAVFGDKSAWNKLIRQAMATDFSWSGSAKKYMELCHKLLGNK